MIGPLHRRLARFRRRRDGATALEFGFILPGLVLMVLGIMEVGMILFATSLLEGGLREAARFGITGLDVNNAAREQHIVDVVNQHGGGLIQITSANISAQIYPDFGSIGKPEPFVDSNGNGSYDGGEPYTDVNCSGAWDPDMGAPGLGVGNDVVIYQIDYDWVMLTGFLAPLIGANGKVPLSASVAVRNEPFGLAGASC